MISVASSCLCPVVCVSRLILPTLRFLPVFTLYYCRCDLSTQCPLHPHFFLAVVVCPAVLPHSCKPHLPLVTGPSSSSRRRCAHGPTTYSPSLSLTHPIVHASYLLILYVIILFNSLFLSKEYYIFLVAAESLSNSKFPSLALLTDGLFVHLLPKK